MSCAPTLQPVPHSYQQRISWTSSSQNRPPTIFLIQKISLRCHSFLLVRSSDARHQNLLPSSRPLSHACETSLGSETSCENLRCSNVEHRCRNASSATDVWKTRRWRGTQTFASITQRQPGSCPTDRTRWCERETETHRLTARGCMPRWLNNVLQPE